MTWITCLLVYRVAKYMYRPPGLRQLRTSSRGGGHKSQQNQDKVRAGNVEKTALDRSDWGIMVFT